MLVDKNKKGNSEELKQKDRPTNVYGTKASAGTTLVDLATPVKGSVNEKSEMKSSRKVTKPTYSQSKDKALKTTDFQGRILQVNRSMHTLPPILSQTLKFTEVTDG